MACEARGPGRGHRFIGQTVRGGLRVVKLDDKPAWVRNGQMRSMSSLSGVKLCPKSVQVYGLKIPAHNHTGLQLGVQGRQEKETVLTVSF